MSHGGKHSAAEVRERRKRATPDVVDRLRDNAEMFREFMAATDRQGRSLVAEDMDEAADDIVRLRADGAGQHPHFDLYCREHEVRIGGCRCVRAEKTRQYADCPGESCPGGGSEERDRVEYGSDARLLDFVHAILGDDPDALPGRDLYENADLALERLQGSAGDDPLVPDDEEYVYDGQIAGAAAAYAAVAHRLVSEGPVALQAPPAQSFRWPHAYWNPDPDPIVNIDRAIALLVRERRRLREGS